MKYLLGISMVSALGGLLFGYDLVVIGGAKEFYELVYGLSGPAIKGWGVSSCIVGCIIGALFVGKPVDMFGRKKMLSLSAVLFFISAIGSGYAPTFAQFIIYRLIGGIGMGIASTVSPMYIAEIAPEKIRGRLVSIQQLNIVIGILLAQLINYLILQSHPIADGVSGAALLDTWNGQTGWRWMFAAEGIWAFLFFVCLFVDGLRRIPPQQILSEFLPLRDQPTGLARVRLSEFSLSIPVSILFLVRATSVQARLSPSRRARGDFGLL